MTFFVTFYSFKGGVGRSLALANTARLLSRRGRRVLVMDLDLEAPGIPFFGRFGQPSPGFVEFIAETRAGGRPDIGDFIQRVDVEERDGSMWVLHAGAGDDHYRQCLAEVHWPEYYTAGGREVLAQLKTQLATRSGWHLDYVLVDARTGLSDMGAIAMLQLADAAVMVFNMNRQNIDGIVQAGHKLTRTRQDVKVFLVASPVPPSIGVEGRLLERLTEVTGQLVGVANPGLDPAKDNSVVLVPYNPRLAFEDVVLADEAPDFCGTRAAYDKLAGQLERSHPTIADFAKGDLGSALAKTLGLQAPPMTGGPQLALPEADPTREVLRAQLLAQAGQVDEAEMAVNRALELVPDDPYLTWQARHIAQSAASAWGDRAARLQGPPAAGEFERAFKKYKEIEAAFAARGGLDAHGYYAWGFDLAKYAQLTWLPAGARDAAYQEAADLLGKALEKDPGMHKARTHLAAVLGERSRLHPGDAGDEMAGQACELFRRAAEDDPEALDPVLGAAQATLMRAFPEGQEPRPEFADQACALLEQAVRVKPEEAMARALAGYAFQRRAGIRTGPERLADLRTAGDHLQAAMSRQPGQIGFVDAWWRCVRETLADSEHDEESEDARQAAAAAAAWAEQLVGMVQVGADTRENRAMGLTEAERICTEVLTQVPGSPELHLALGRIYRVRAGIETGKQKTRLLNQAERVLASLPEANRSADQLFELGVVRSTLAEGAKGSQATEFNTRAIEAFAGAVGLRPTLAEALHNQAVCHERITATLDTPAERLEALGKARDCYEAALRAQGPTAGRHEALANCLVLMAGQGDAAAEALLREAVTHYREAVRLNSRAAGPCAKLGQTLTALAGMLPGDEEARTLLGEAVSVLVQASKLAQDEAEVFMLRGEAQAALAELMPRSDRAEGTLAARESARWATRLAPDNAAAWLRRLDLLKRILRGLDAAEGQELGTEAVTCLEEALAPVFAADTPDIESWLGSFATLQVAVDQDRARALAHRALTEVDRRATDDAWWHLLRGLARDNLGDLAPPDEAADLYRGAVEHYRRACELDPDYRFAHYLLAGVSLSLGRVCADEERPDVLAEGTRHARRAAELDDGNADNHLRWAHCLQAQAAVADPEDAAALCEEALGPARRALELAPDDAEPLSLVGGLMVDLSQMVDDADRRRELIRDGREHLLKAHQTDPRNPGVCSMLASIDYLALAGDVSEAESERLTGRLCGYIGRARRRGSDPAEDGPLLGWAVLVRAERRRGPRRWRMLRQAARLAGPESGVDPADPLGVQVRALAQVQLAQHPEPEDPAGLARELRALEALLDGMDDEVQRLLFRATVRSAQGRLGSPEDRLRAEDEALEFLEQAQANRPEDPVVRQNILAARVTRADLMEGDQRRAALEACRTELEEQLQDDPDDYDHRYCLACCLALLGRTQNALAELRRCAKHRPMACRASAWCDPDFAAMACTPELQAFIEEPDPPE